MSRKPVPHDRNRHLKMWLAVAGSFLAVVGVWMLQLRVSGHRKDVSIWRKQFGQELKNSTRELNSFAQQPIIEPTSEPITQEISEATLERLKEKIEEKTNSNDSSAN